MGSAESLRGTLDVESQGLEAQPTSVTKSGDSNESLLFSGPWCPQLWNEGVNQPQWLHGCLWATLKLIRGAAVWCGDGGTHTILLSAPSPSRASCVLCTSWISTESFVRGNVFLSKMYLSGAVLGFCGCTRAFSSGRTQGLLPSCGEQASHCCGLSCWGTRAPECRLSSCGARLRCPEACGIFLQ